MLPVASAAAIAHMTTRWRHTVARRLNNLHHPCPRKVALHFDVLNVDHLARQRTSDEHHATIGATRHGLTAGDETLNLQ